jgi:hypothetical protein
MWYCIHCGKSYAYVDAGPEYRDLPGFQAKSGCCTDCDPSGYQMPGMTSFDYRKDLRLIHPDKLALLFLGEINFYSRRNSLCPLTLSNPLSDSPASTSS